MRLTLTLPWPPQVNNLHIVARGRKVLSAKGRDYYAAVAFSVARQCRSKRPMLTGPVRYSAVAHPPDYRRRDLSNLIKATEDALTKAGVWKDDRQVMALAWGWGHREPGGRLLVTIEPMEASSVTP